MAEEGNGGRKIISSAAPRERERERERGREGERERELERGKGREREREMIERESDMILLIRLVRDDHLKLYCFYYF